MTTNDAMPTDSASEIKPAFVYSTTRDWPGYFEATKGREPRETLLNALELFERDADTKPRFAIDFGCGEGRDTAELLRRGWRVLAIDGHPDGLRRLMQRRDHDAPERLTMQLVPFERVELPRCDLFNASFSLPFCDPGSFDQLWSKIVGSIVPGGRFAGQLFGERDSWASIADRSHHTRERVEELLGDLEIESLKEDERDGQDCTGTGKHWHVYHIIARKPID